MSQSIEPIVPCFARILIVAALLAAPGAALARAPAPLSDPVLPRFPALRLDDPLRALDRYGHPSVERTSATARFLDGPWGMARWERDAWTRLRLDELATPDTDVAPARTCPGLLWLGGAREAWMPSALMPEAAPAWEWDALQAPPPRCTRPAVRFGRWGAESDRFPLLRCDGSVDAEAIDRLSLMTRPVGVPRPALPLPDQPDDDAEQGAWMRSIRLVEPRLVWLVQKVADAWPGKSLYVVSGYRPGAHEGFHGKGRAVDLSVTGVAKEELYALCRKLPDVGCGYYPNHDFVHLDVRAPGSGHAYWIDDSRPGEASHYVDGWSGVEGSGGNGSAL